MEGHEEPFAHGALFYADEDEFLSGTVPFVLEGVEAGEAVLVALPPANLRRLEQALGSDAGKVELADMGVIGRNPGRIIGVWREFADEHAGASIRGIGEPVWAGRTAEELVECQQHEELLNVAFHDVPAFALLCPYNTTDLPDDVLAKAERSHPHVVRDGASVPSDAYWWPDQADEALVLELAPVPARAQCFIVDAASLGHIRGAVGEVARGAGMSVARAADLQLALSEIAANTLRHAGGIGTLHVWTDGGSVVCDLTDGGRIADPLVGRRRPAHDRPSGRGLWLAHNLCDLVQVRSGPSGTNVRLRMAVDG